MSQEHKDITGNELHNSKLELINNNPIGNKLPPTSGYLVINTNDLKLYFADGTNSNDWFQPITKSDPELIPYASGTIKSELDELQKEKTTIYNYSGVNLNTERIIGSFDKSQILKAEYSIMIQDDASKAIYSTKITLLQDGASDSHFNEFETTTLKRDAATWKAGTYGLTFSVTIGTTNVELKVRTTGSAGVPSASIKSVQKLF